ncbi:hypothetical protein FQN57_002631 [Myotisia sp. PD_48]|nr:hypothetical protein FQN57_002631 [Myotisia sp. PD_48]
MFELPNAKRVCRGDLNSPAISRSPSPVEDITAAYATSVFQNLFAPANTSVEPIELEEDHNDKDEQAEEEQEFEFRLFRSNTTKNKGQDGDGAADVQKLKIRIRSPTPSLYPVTGEGRFTVPFRGWEHYFSDPQLVIRAFGGSLMVPAVDSRWKNRGEDGQSAVEADRFKDVAVDGRFILERAVSTPWTGSRFPLRVIHLPASKLKPSAVTGSSSSGKTASSTVPLSLSKRRKPGKKKRIALRKGLVAKQTAEEADKNKRIQRNREKKLKRRQKAKDAKALTLENTVISDI